jgi:hypothetical protein
MIATASLPIHLGGKLYPAVPVDGALRAGPAEIAAAADGVFDVSRTVPRRPWRTAVMDFFELLGLVWSVPLVVLAVASPVVLTIALLLWLGRLALRAF